MHINNYVPTIVEKSARRATRIVYCGGARALKFWKKRAHRAYRHNIKTQLRRIVSLDMEIDDYNDTPSNSQRCTFWDIAY